MSVAVLWTMLAGFLVLFLQLGFAMVEAGMCRAKNAGHTFAMKLMIYPLAGLAFYVYGFAFGWGNWSGGPGVHDTLGSGLASLHTGITWTLGNHPWHILGGKGFFLSGLTDPAALALFFLMLVLLTTAAAIPTGTMAERWAWGNFCLYGLVVALPCAIFGGWVWGGGWLAQLGTNLGWGNGACDAGGSGVVHMMGGIIALAGSLAIGPRLGKYVKGRAQAIPGHSLPLVIGGTIILAFGWFGFSAGPAGGAGDQLPVIAVNTLLAGMVGALAAMALVWAKFGKPDPSLMCNGLLAGLVAITAGGAYVSPLGALLIGAVAGVLVVYSVFFFDNLGVDDCVGAISVHGVAGVWGVLAVGLFATGDHGVGVNGITHGVTGILPLQSATGAAYFGPLGWSQLACQALEVVAGLAVGFGLMFPFFKFSSRIARLRVSSEVELRGLDLPEVGAAAYPDFELKTIHSWSAASDPRESIDRAERAGSAYSRT